MQIILVYLYPCRRNSLFCSRKSPKITKTPYFGCSRSYKVNDVDISKKLIASACFVRHHVISPMQSPSNFEVSSNYQNIFVNKFLLKIAKFEAKNNHFGQILKASLTLFTQVAADFKFSYLVRFCDYFKSFLPIFVTKKTEKVTYALSSASSACEKEFGIRNATAAEAKMTRQTPVAIATFRSKRQCDHCGIRSFSIILSVRFSILATCDQFRAEKNLSSGQSFF